MAEVFTPDNLRAGDYPMVTDNVIVAATAGVLPRGRILGRINIGTVPSTGTLVAGGSANGTCTSVLGGPDTIGGVYKLTCIAAAAHGGTFQLTSPLGIVLQTVAIAGGAGGTAVFNTDELKCTITDGSTDFDLGDYFTVTIPAGSGKYKSVDSAAVDGTAAARAVLLADINATSLDVDAPVALTGEFDTSALSCGGTDTPAVHREYMRRNGMFQKVSSRGGLSI